MSKRFTPKPPHPERKGRGCDCDCPAASLACGNGSERTQHPAKLFGAHGFEWSGPAAPAAPAVPD